MTTSQNSADALDTSKAVPRFVWLAAVVVNTMMVMGGMLLLGTQLNQGGIGMRFNVNDEGTFDVDYVFNNSPAEAAGLQAGDRVVAINGEALAIGADEPYSLPPDPSLTFTIEDDGATRDIEVERAAGWFDFFSVGGLVSGIPITAIQILALALDILFYLIFLAVSAMVFWSRAGKRIYLLIAVTLLFLGANFTLGFVAFYDGGAILNGIGTAHYYITALLAVITLLLIPDMKAQPTWAWAIPLVMLVVIVLSQVGVLPRVTALFAQLVAFILGTVILYLRYRRSPEGAERNLMRPFLIGVVFMLGGYALVNLLENALIPMLLPQPWAAWPYIDFWGSIFQMLTALVLPYMLWKSHKNGTI